MWLGLIEAGGPASRFELGLRMRVGGGVPRNAAPAERLMGHLAVDLVPPALHQFGLWLLAKAETDEDRR